MDESKFKVGDVVELNSGGPPMTVSDIKVSSGVTCMWINNNKVESAIFTLAMLKPYKQPSRKAPNPIEEYSPRGNIV